MRQSLVTFLCFLLTAAVIVVAEGLFLFLSFEKIKFKLAHDAKDALALTEREAALQRIEGMRGTLEAKTSALLAGYTLEPMNISQETFGDLFLLGVQISPVD